MKLILAIIVILVIGGSIFADYKWRKWMAERRRERAENDRGASS